MHELRHEFRQRACAPSMPMRGRWRPSSIRSTSISAFHGARQIRIDYDRHTVRYVVARKELLLDHGAATGSLEPESSEAIAAARPRILSQSRRSPCSSADFSAIERSMKLAGSSGTLPPNTTC